MSQSNLWVSSQARFQSLVIEADNFCLQHNIDSDWLSYYLGTLFSELCHWCYDQICSGAISLIPSYPEIRDYIIYIPALFGEHTIDRFAASNNVQVASGRYNSKFFLPEATCLNAFSCHRNCFPSGTLDNNWIHPPHNLIRRVYLHLISCQAICTVMLPVWPSALWWPDSLHLH